MTSCAVAVVGHVDHGKTSLVRALTGQDTDRLEEEKARGLSITLGFAHRAYETGIVDLIDSPGHEDFIRAMVCGTTGAQAALIVISAVDGIERQTREHMEILHHLNISCGVVALTKVDLVPEAERASVRKRIADALRGSSFAAEPHILCSSETREGLDTLHDALETLIHRAPPPLALPGAYLPIDRAFSVKGVGTVATGTLLGAPIRLADGAVLLPGGQTAVVRRLQSRGDDTQTARPGMRTAVNLRGIALDSLRRGDVICAPGLFAASKEIDAWVEMAAGGGMLKHGDTIRVMIGTASRVATLLAWGGRKAIAGHGVHVRLRFGETVTTHAKQRGILRRLSPAETIGGICVLDPSPRALRRRDPAWVPVLDAARHGAIPELVGALAAYGKGAVRLADLDRLAGGSVDVRALPDLEILDTDYASTISAVQGARTALLEALKDALARQPERNGIPAADLREALSDRFAAPLVDHVTG
ncbi:MAG: GTP-binding protein, partial [Pseudomonadota bacterium]